MFLLALCLWAGLAALGCEPAIEFDVDLSGQTEVQGSLVGNVLSALDFAGFGTLDFSSTEEFENNDVTREHVKAARLTALELTVVQPAGGNLDFIDELSFFAEAEGQDKVKVASATVPDGVQNVQLEPEDVDLGPYVRSESMALTTEADARPPNEDTTLEANLTVHITAVP
jgi:hypothetical protein